MTVTVDPNLADSMAGLIRAIRREYRRQLRYRGLDLTLFEIQALEILERDPGARLYQLVDETGLDKAQVTRATKALENKGLIGRERDPEDQRCFRLYLSVEGSRVRGEIRGIRADIEERLYSGLDDHEQTQLAALVGRCLSSLQCAAPESRP